MSTAPGIGHISHRPKRAKYRRTLHHCECGRSEYGTARWERCRMCQAALRLEAQREARKKAQTPALPDWQTEPRPLSMVACDAVEADEYLRERGIVIRRNGRPLADWYLELIRTAGLTKWHGEVRPDAEFVLDRGATALARFEGATDCGRRVRPYGKGPR